MCNFPLQRRLTGLARAPPYSCTAGDYTALLDTDVSMTVDGDYLWWIRTYAADESAFHCEFSEAFLHVSELGYSDEFLVASWDAPGTPFACGLEGPETKQTCVDQCGDTQIGRRRIPGRRRLPDNTS